MVIMGFDKDRFIAGFAGAGAFQLFHPLDVIRTRLQTIDKCKHQNINYSANYLSLMKEMVRKEGIYSLYRGNMYSVSINVVLGLFFMTNEKLKKQLERVRYF